MTDTLNRQLRFTAPSTNNTHARIGGGSLIGDLADWPVAPDGTPLTLVLSLPAWFLNEHAGCDLPGEQFISVFSYFSETEYFLDAITYHGCAEELAWLRRGYTRVMLHPAGQEVFAPITLPAMALEIEHAGQGSAAAGCSHMGGAPVLLQAQALELGDERFTLQLYGGSFPKPFHGIFGLSDAIGYLFIQSGMPPAAQLAEAGTLFVQVS